MTSDRAAPALLLAVLAAGCGSGGTTSGGGIAGPAANVMTITVNGSLCLSTAYPNEPCVAVTVCSSTSTTGGCQTIDGILLDTGSSGLRIFRQALTVPLQPVASGSGQLAECIQYADGSSEWGPVETARVVLGGEPAVVVPSRSSTAPSPRRPPPARTGTRIPPPPATTACSG